MEPTSVVGEVRMFSLTISDYIMVAHSIHDADFAPARALHGNTLVVEVTFRAERLDPMNFLVDVDRGKAELRRILATMDYKNLDELPEFTGQNTTMEFLSQYIHRQLAEACADGRLGDAAKAVVGLEILLRESPQAWASYDAPIA
jgi:6-pyruvoyl-tetrahydropterin synthase